MSSASRGYALSALSAGINELKAAVITLTAAVALVDPGPLGGTCVNRG